MKRTLVLALALGALPGWLSSCHHKADDPTPEPALTGQWKADSLHYTNYSPAGAVTGRGTLFTNPGTTLMIDGTTMVDQGSLGSNTTYTYTRQSNSLTLNYSQAGPQRMVTIEELTDHRLRLSYVLVVGIAAPTSQMHGEVFYSR